MRLLWIALGALFAAYAGLALYVYFFQERLVYLPDLPSRRVDATPASVGLSFETLDLATEDGETLAAWFVPAPDPRGTVLYFHGNGGNIGHRVEIVRDFHDLGYNVLIFDYRGYGASSGSPGEQGSYRDAMAAWRHLTETRRIPAESIVFFGESLGGAVAAWLAERHKPGALVFYAAFTSIEDMARTLYPILPLRLVVRLGYDTRTALAGVKCPVLILHSSEDEIVPYAQGEALYATAPGKKELVTLRGGHNDALFLSRDRYRQAVGDFLQLNLAASK
ncbi:MAG: alpha/beta hydrolase [Sulfurimicrobium sp.]|nr:alpha/beta hydrolase [Sulfurimicrobium sp.]MDP1705983.1 alpha/beta hydrolase [Sulfurimicrobium sp.]MDP2199369.1 alpha/beta hydrolase [Sulfurimicrobium sp.]MDP3686252.1 alpha/beta hydrolase [Sulfurimicrobium sp.]